LAKIIVTGRGNRKYSYLDLIKTPKMRRLALLTGITWCVKSQSQTHTTVASVKGCSD